METGKDKVRKICDVLRKETLEPSQKQAEEMLAQASLQAQEIIAQAYLKQKQLLVDAKEQIQRELTTKSMMKSLSVFFHEN